MNIDYLGKTYTVVEEKDIIEVFKEMLDDVGEATSLGVKEALREKDFWVDQKTVSTVISDYVAYNPGVYLVTHENGHKVYQLDWGNSSPASPVVVKPKAKKGEYVVWAPSLTSKMTGDCPTEVYSDITRNAARYAYAKKYGVDYTEVSAKVC